MKLHENKFSSFGVEDWYTKCEHFNKIEKYRHSQGPLVTEINSITVLVQMTASRIETAQKMIGFTCSLMFGAHLY
jgi:hypothetical protein